MKKQDVPKKGFAALTAYFKDDFLAGFSVSLIALPLCLGIAIASGVPPLAGLITAIVGGLIASRISGTFVTISGPAAGLIVITLGASESMGGAGAASGFAGYPHALGAILIGGLIMALFGLLKVGKVGDYFPSAAVHGMLAAIGIIIIVKQFFPAIGAPSPKGEILEVIGEIPHAFTEYNPFALGIAIVALIVLILHPFVKFKPIKVIPAPMWVLILTIPLAAFLGTDHLSMVEMPHNLLGEGGIQFPSFAKIGESAFWVAVTGFALVSAIESLLSAKAVDSLDPYKRSSNLNMDLVSMGAGSSLAAAIGGLPMISEIVRSSANVNNGAKTQWSNFYHGMFLLIYLLIGVFIIEMIPISALAAMLVFTGFRLASPKEFKHMFQIGIMELEIFIVTLFAVLATDLIIGIVIGIIFKYVLLIFKGVSFNSLFKAHVIETINGNTVVMKLSKSLIFSNYLSLKTKMDKAILRHTVLNLDLDLTDVTLIDHTVMEHLEDYSKQLHLKGKEVHIINIDELNPVSNHPLAARDRNLKKMLANTTITSRTIALMSFAHQKEFEFQNKTEDFDSWNFYLLSIRKKIISVQNLIRFKTNKIQYELADIVTQTGALATQEIDKITVLKISGLAHVPKFYLQESNLIDQLKNQLGHVDVNFSEHPNFSKKYNIRADEKERNISSFFTNRLISHLETINPLFISGNGQDLLIHFEVKRLNTEEINLLIKTATGIVNQL
jgi:MFS superfamily sulfate permease-like transporter